MRADKSFAALMSLLLLLSSVEAANYSSVADAKAALQQAEQQAATAKTQRESLGNQIEASMREISRLSGQGPDVREIDNQRNGLFSKINALTFACVAKLAELRQGMFCSGCGKTRSELLAAGEPFPHPGQHPVPATPEQLAAAAHECETEISPLKSEMDRLSQMRESRVREFQAQVDAKQRELQELRRRLPDLASEISRAQSQKIRARNGVALMEQKEALATVEKDMRERAELKAQAEKKRYQAQLAWRQVEDAQRILSAARVTNSWQANQPNESKPQQNTQPDAEERKLEEAARQAREQASKAEERAVELEQRVRDSQPASLGDAPLQQVAESIEAIETAEEERSITRKNPGETSAAAQLLSLTATKTEGFDVGRAVDQFSDILARAQNQAGKSIADGRKVIKTAAEKAIRSKMEDAERQVRPDLLGLAATTRLSNTEGPVPAKFLEGAVNDAFRDASSIVLSDVNERSAIAQSLTDSAIERVSGWYSRQIRDRIISMYNEVDFGIADASKSSDPFERGKDAFYKAISRANLLMETGGTSVSGLRKYLGGVLNPFFNYLDLIPDRLAESTDPGVQNP